MERRVEGKGHGPVDGGIFIHLWMMAYGVLDDAFMGNGLEDDGLWTCG